MRIEERNVFFFWCWFVAIAFLNGGCAHPRSRLSTFLNIAADTSDGRCHANGNPDEMWLVDWDPSSQVRLQTRAGSGIILVRYRDCHLEVLRGCELDGEYRFTPSEPLRNVESIENRGELFAKLPLGALNLHAEYRAGDRWSLDYLLTGAKDASVRTVERRRLPAQCRQATHFVQGMVVGAYELRSDARVSAGASTSVRAVGVGGGGDKRSQVLRRAGDFSGCVQGGPPWPRECRTIVKLYLEPIQTRAGALPASRPAPVLDLGVLQYRKTELVTFPHFVVSSSGHTMTAVIKALPPAIQSRWAAMRKLEAEVRRSRAPPAHIRRLRKLRDVLAEKLGAMRRTGSTAVALAVLNYESIYRNYLATPMTEKIPVLDLSASIEQLEWAAQAVSADEPSGFWARYLLAEQYTAMGREEKSIPLLEALAKAKWRRRTPDVFFLIGNYRSDIRNDYDDALKSYLKMAESASKYRDAHSYGVALVHSGVAAFHSGRFYQSIALATTLLKEPGPQPLSAHMTALIAESVEHLGGLSKEPLRALPKALYSKVARILADRAVARHANEEAKQIWEAMLARTPEALEAPYALEGLVALAELRGYTRRARMLSKMRSETYGITSDWAKRQRAARDRFGTPSDEAIALAISATRPVLASPPRSAVEHRRDAVKRIDGLFSHCFAPVAEMRYSNLAVEIRVSLNREGGATVKAQPLIDNPSNHIHPAVRNALSCIEADGGRYFSGVTVNIKAVIGSPEQSREALSPLPRNPARASKSSAPREAKPFCSHRVPRCCQSPTWEGFGHKKRPRISSKPLELLGWS